MAENFMNWNNYFIEMAGLISLKSKDRSTKVGVVVVCPDNVIISTGYNGFPRFVNDNIDERHERPQKYSWTEHAERNAIYNAARIGVSLKDCIMYFNYEPIPCTNCARAVIQAGIKKLIGPNKPFPGVGDFWKSDSEISKIMLKEAGVNIITIFPDTLGIKSSHICEKCGNEMEYQDYSKFDSYTEFFDFDSSIPMKPYEKNVRIKVSVYKCKTCNYEKQVVEP